MSNLIMGEMDEINNYLKSLDEDEVKYFLYLTKQGIEFGVIKDYVSRLKKIKENFGDEFIKNKCYDKIPGSRNYIALNGRYILSNSIIELIKKDIKQIYSFNKRISAYSDIDSETVIINIQEFMLFMVNNGYKKIEEDLIIFYLNNLNVDKKLKKK